MPQRLFREFLQQQGSATSCRFGRVEVMISMAREDRRQENVRCRGVPQFNAPADAPPYGSGA